MEPIPLKHFIHQRVRNLREAVSKIYSGEALCYTFDDPNALFVGTIPYQAQAIWHLPQEVTLHISSGGCTFFLWSHQVENLVVTGLVSHRFQIHTLNIDLTFHIFDSIKFCTTLKVDELRDKMEEFLLNAFRDHQYDDLKSHQFTMFNTEQFFKMNRLFQKYGVAVTQIVPSVALKQR
ncbi:hypothetical protein TRFO_11286 [Tritrichomonas foetus]|uniref:Band 7 domain-containing protein n=1 Tax=Tritrichomonas foetus TaxID=1144522 RepID=A0A1J4J954_9EUKA|nr:hypothetical protein TRFO_11286 [Tritrichomonas foetus]|eukprot:OHS94211.1 hypothetical protein TRFO_11286 [Tritrichomonas foetus]